MSVEMEAAPLSKAERRKQQKADKEEKRAGKPLAPKTGRQADLLNALDDFPVVIALGPAGTGKTYVSARHALKRLDAGSIENFVITRPTVAQARHRLGFQPGGVNQKLRPWLIPVLDALRDGCSAAQIDRFVEQKRIEFLGFEHMRGRTIRNGVFLLDEAQNCSTSDLEMFVTRIGEDGQAVICGDPHQTDIDDSGLTMLADMVSRYRLNAAVIRFSEDEVVRSQTAAEWVKAFSRERHRTLSGV